MPSFGNLGLIHVSIDTYSGMIFASIHNGESTAQCIPHLQQAFAHMGLPKTIKTDNGPSYKGHIFQTFISDCLLNVLQAFLIILKDKPSSNVPTEL